MSPNVDRCSRTVLSRLATYCKRPCRPSGTGLGMNGVGWESHMRMRVLQGPPRFRLVRIQLGGLLDYTSCVKVGVPRRFERAMYSCMYVPGQCLWACLLPTAQACANTDEKCHGTFSYQPQFFQESSCIRSDSKY